MKDDHLVATAILLLQLSTEWSIIASSHSYKGLTNFSLFTLAFSACEFLVWWLLPSNSGKVVSAVPIGSKHKAGTDIMLTRKPQCVHSL